MKTINYSGEYFIKPGYIPRVKNLYYNDFSDEGILWQPDVYRLAEFLADHISAKYIIDIGSGSGEKLLPFVKNYKIIAVDFGDNLNLIKKVIGKKHTFINQNFEKNFPPLDKKILSESVVICSDVIEHIVKPDKLLNGLLDMAQTAPFVLVSTPDRVRTWGIPHFGPPPNEAHVREWNLEELHALFKAWGFKQFLFGRTLSNDASDNKATSLIISGTYSAPNKDKSKNTARLLVRVKQGVSSSTIGYYIDQDCVVILDDGKRYHLYIDDPAKTVSSCERTQTALQKELARKHISSYWSFECYDGAKLSSLNPESSLGDNIRWIDGLGYSVIGLCDLVKKRNSFKITNDERLITKTSLPPKQRKTFVYPFVVEGTKSHKRRRPFQARKFVAQGSLNPDFHQDYIVEIITGSEYGREVKS